MKPLTPRERAMLTLIEETHAAHGVSPSYQEMMEALELSSLSRVSELVTRLEQKGYVRRHRGGYRNLELLTPSLHASDVWLPEPDEPYRVPEGKRYVRVEDLERLHRAWLRRRGSGERRSA